MALPEFRDTVSAYCPDKDVKSILGEVCEHLMNRGIPVGDWIARMARSRQDPGAILCGLLKEFFAEELRRQGFFNAFLAIQYLRDERKSHGLSFRTFITRTKPHQPMVAEEMPAYLLPIVREVRQAGRTPVFLARDAEPFLDAYEAFRQSIPDLPVPYLIKVPRSDKGGSLSKQINSVLAADERAELVTTELAGEIADAFRHLHAEDRERICTALKLPRADAASLINGIVGKTRGEVVEATADIGVAKESLVGVQLARRIRELKAAINSSIAKDGSWLIDDQWFRHEDPTTESSLAELQRKVRDAVPGETLTKKEAKLVDTRVFRKYLFERAVRLKGTLSSSTAPFLQTVLKGTKFAGICRNVIFVDENVGYGRTMSALELLVKSFCPSPDWRTASIKYSASKRKVEDEVGAKLVDVWSTNAIFVAEDVPANVTAVFRDRETFLQKVSYRELLQSMGDTDEVSKEQRRTYSMEVDSFIKENSDVFDGLLFLNKRGKMQQFPRERIIDLYLSNGHPIFESHVLEELIPRRGLLDWESRLKEVKVAIDELRKLEESKPSRFESLRETFAGLLDAKRRQILERWLFENEVLKKRIRATVQRLFRNTRLKREIIDYVDAPEQQDFAGLRGMLLEGLESIRLTRDSCCPLYPLPETAPAYLGELERPAGLETFRHLKTYFRNLGSDEDRERFSRMVLYRDTHIEQLEAGRRDRRSGAERVVIVVPFANAVDVGLRYEKQGDGNLRLGSRTLSLGSIAVTTGKAFRRFSWKVKVAGFVEDKNRSEIRPVLEDLYRKENLEFGDLLEIQQDVTRVNLFIAGVEPDGECQWRFVAGRFWRGGWRNPRWVDGG